MQITHGLKSILSFPLVYDAFQNLVGARRARRWVATRIWRLKGGEKVVDIGCGPGEALEDLPANVRYVGFDLSEAYVEAARRKYGSRGTFHVGTAESFLAGDANDLMGADLVFCTGLLHHLDDPEVLAVFRLARRILLPQGRFVAVEPTFLEHQGRASERIMRQDRGCNVRKEAEWKALLAKEFEIHSTTVMTGLLRIPYIHIALEGKTSPTT